ncbi:MAG: DUF2339 domain-containing protein [Planctomycetaceae bacterium]|nr:DUF2339 domain-containing protein [Planctomycetaceae bacterium]
MEEVIFALVLLVILLPVGLTGAILAIVALVKLSRMRRSLSEALGRLANIERRIASGAMPAAPARPASAPAAAPTPVTLAPAPAAPQAPPPIPELERAPAPQRVWAEPTVPPAPAGESMESQIGKKWMTWAGAVVLLLGAVFFLKYAFDNDWIGPTAQVFLCALGGMVAIAAGIFCLEKKWRILGQGIIGLGLGVLYATFYSACSVYEPKVMDNAVAFAFMVVVTAIGVALAVRYNALTLAFLALLGGLLTPVLVSTGENRREALFTYLLILDLGVLAVALWRNFRALDALALVGTIVLYAGWYGQHYDLPQLAPAMIWLTIFYLVFLIEPFAYNLATRTAVGVERFLMAIVNATFYMIMAWTMLYGQYNYTLGFIALGMAASYLAVGALLRRRVETDTRSLLASIVMAVTFLTLAVPLHLSANGIMLAWVAEGPVLLFLAYRYRYQPARVLAAMVLAVGIVTLLGEHWPDHDGLFVIFWNKQFISAAMVPLAMGVFALVGRLYRAKATAADRAVELVVALAAGILGLSLLHSELWQYIVREGAAANAEYYATLGAIFLWTAGAAVYLLTGARTRNMAVYAVGLAALAVAMICTFGAYSFPRFGEHVLLVNVRMLAAAAVVAMALLFARTIALGASGEGKAFAAAILWAALAGLLILLSGEAWAYCLNSIADSAKAERAGQMSITLVWGLFALTMLYAGFARRLRPVRLAALGLFALAALKLVFVDMMHVKDVYRILSFMGLGLLLIGSAYLYHKLEKRLAPSQPKLEEPAP